MESQPRAGDLLQALCTGDRVALGRAITLIESTLVADRSTAMALVESALPHSGRSLRLGITGIPGVGKSTLIDALGRNAIQRGMRVAVLATDPSSARSGGSILGDKTRMEELSRSDQAFIRPTPSSGFLGGVAKRTRETIVLCEAAGYDLVLVETVGVGQSELEVDGMTDLNLLLMIPGAGDELQGIKRGIMESADVIVLTKAASAFHDGPDAGKYLGTRNALRNAIGFLPPRENGLRPQVLLTDALSGDGIDALLQLVLDRSVQDSRTGYVAHRRQQQNVQWMHHALRQGLMESLQADPRMKAALADVEDRVRDGLQSPFGAASDLLEAFRTGGVHLP